MVFATLDSFIYDLSRAGRLTGVGALDRAKGLSSFPMRRERRGIIPRKPSVVARFAGGDVTWKNHAPNSLTVFTANTDFAETEVDTRQINLTRFPCSFRRSGRSFSRRANQYDFGWELEPDSPAIHSFLQPANWNCWAARKFHQRGSETERAGRKMEPRLA